jgi:hypothetical protein
LPGQHIRRQLPGKVVNAGQRSIVAPWSNIANRRSAVASALGFAWSHCPLQPKRKVKMTSFDDLKTTIRRNKLLGMWAAEKLGLADADADAYSHALAMDTADPERGDVFRRIREDFDAAGVIQSDEQIVRVMNELMIQAGEMQATGGGGSDAAAVMLARKLTA